MTTVSRLAQGPYRIVWTIEDWVSALRECRESEVWSLDFESRPAPGRLQSTSAVRAEDGSEVCGIGIAWVRDGAVRSAYIGIRHDVVNAGGRQPSASQALKALSDHIESRGQTGMMVVANLAMELSFMLAEGVCWPPRGCIHDVQIAARVLNRGVGPRELIGLKLMQAHILGKDMASKNDLDEWLLAKRLKPGADIWRAPVAIAGKYCQDDCRDALDIFLPWIPEVVKPPTDWWWRRKPDKTTRTDLYELEVEVAIDAILAGLRGGRVDLRLADRRSAAAEALQNVCAAWIREKMGLPDINPASATQLRGVLFGAYGFKVSLGHLTEGFKKLTDRDQALVLADKTGQAVVQYASLDVDALDYYASQHPEHSDLVFMLAVHRKCQTALTWFRKNVSEHGHRKMPDPWWEPDEAVLMDLIFHRLRTVGTLSGRMSSSDYNAQQIAKRFKMLIDAERVISILREFIPASQLEELKSMLDLSSVATDDESKSVKLPLGEPVIDFSIKAMFIPRPGMNIRSFDLSQVEMRGFAHFSGNGMLCRGYGGPMQDELVDAVLANVYEFVQSGRWPDCIDWEYHRRLERNPFDIHAFVSKQVGISRKEAKGVNFGIVYGMGKRKLARERGWTPQQGEEYLRRYYEQFPEITVLQAQIQSALRRRGYIFDPYGRRYYLGPDKAYVGLNRLIQGWAAGVFKVGVARVCDLMESVGDRRVHPITKRVHPTGAKMLTCVHDDFQAEIPFEVDDYRFDWGVRTCMTAVHGLKVPLGASSERSSESLDKLVAC